MKTRRQSAVEEDLNLPLINQEDSIEIIPNKELVTDLNLPAEKNATKVLLLPEKLVVDDEASLLKDDGIVEDEDKDTEVVVTVEGKGKGKELITEESKEVVDLNLNKDLLLVINQEESIKLVKSKEQVEDQSNKELNILLVKESSKEKEIINSKEQVSSSSSNSNIPFQQDSPLTDTDSASEITPMDIDIPIVPAAVVVAEEETSIATSNKISPSNSKSGEIKINHSLSLGSKSNDLSEQSTSTPSSNSEDPENSSTPNNDNENSDPTLEEENVDPANARLDLVQHAIEKQESFDALTTNGSMKSGNEVEVEVEDEKVKDDIIVDEVEEEEEEEEDEDEDEEDDDDDDSNNDPSEGGNAHAGPSNSNKKKKKNDNGDYSPTTSTTNTDSVKRSKRMIKGPSAKLGKEKIKTPRIPRVMKEKPAGAPARKGGVVGRLSWLSNKLPIELMIEILSHLSPDMLLRLTRTAKLFRSVLLSKGYRGLWINALEQCDGLVFKAKDWTEVQYTSLMWDKECALCNRAGVHKSDYSFRMRMCDKCAKTMTSSQEKIELVNPSIHPLTWELCLSSERRINSRTPGVLYYHTPTVVATNAYLTTLMVQDTDEPHTEPNNPDAEGEILSRIDLFKKERSELLPLIKEDMEAIHIWQDRLERERSADREKLLLERKVAILRRCEAAGYDGNTVVAVIQSPTSQVVKYTHQPYPLTDRVWTKISTFIYNEIARFIEAKRLAAEEAIKRKAESDEAARLRLQALYRAGAGLPGGIDGLNNWMDGHYDNYDGYDSDDYAQY